MSRGSEPLGDPAGPADADSIPRGERRVVTARHSSSPGCTRACSRNPLTHYRKAVHQKQHHRRPTRTAQAAPRGTEPPPQTTKRTGAHDDLAHDSRCGCLGCPCMAACDRDGCSCARPRPQPGQAQQLVLVACGEKTVRRRLHRFNQAGLEGLEDLGAQGPQAADHRGRTVGDHRPGQAALRGKRTRIIDPDAGQDVEKVGRRGTGAVRGRLRAGAWGSTDGLVRPFAGLP